MWHAMYYTYIWEFWGVNADKLVVEPDLMNYSEVKSQGSFPPLSATDLKKQSNHLDLDEEPPLNLGDVGFSCSRANRLKKK